jgi:hypothetical protein
MSLIYLILLGSILLLPAVALWALRWAARNGELSHTDRAALLPFSEEEPVGQMTDAILHREQKPPESKP